MQPERVMPIHEIPRNEWKGFFTSFSRAHDGWLCTLEVFAPELGAEVKTRGRPFEGIDVEERGGEGRVQIFIGKEPDGHEEHELEGATGVWLEDLDGAGSGLRIEGKGGMARLWFRSPMLPEQVDGIA
jgi:hypothetical protein